MGEQVFICLNGLPFEVNNNNNNNNNKVFHIVLIIKYQEENFLIFKSK